MASLSKANREIFNCDGSGCSSTLSKRINSTTESCEIQDDVGFFFTALLVQRVRPTKYFPSFVRRNGFCHVMQLAGNAGSGLSRDVRGTGMVCALDHVFPRSSL